MARPFMPPAPASIARRWDCCLERLDGEAVPTPERAVFEGRLRPYPPAPVLRYAHGMDGLFEQLGFGAEARRGALRAAADAACGGALRLAPGESALVIANPHGEAARIAFALYDAAARAGTRPVLVFQNEKTQFDFAEPAVLAAIESRPAAVMSVSAGKLGKDARGMERPYRLGGAAYDHVFHLIRRGEKSCRAFWSPGASVESFCRAVPVDYGALRARCRNLRARLSAARAVRVSAPGGTDIRLGLGGRTARSDDGDFSRPGSGGNLPAGEVFVSPENGTAEGRIVFDGSLSLYDGDILLREPVECVVSGGFVREIRGGAEAAALRETIARAEADALECERAGRLPAGAGAAYARNARNIGELGIGMNPAALVAGNMLEDEKARGTCHFALGHNYDDDAPALIHLDGLVRRPSIAAVMPDGREEPLLRDGEPP